MDKIVITIGREYGSGGRMIAKKLAEAMNIKFYDKELISLAAKESGFSEDFIKQNEQKKTNSFLYNLCVSSTILPVNDQIFLAQSEAIKKICENESCIIVGRCADYILREHKNCINVFVYAPLEEKIKRVKEEYGYNENHVEEFIVKTDKERAGFYNHFTPNKWGNPHNYHICINSVIGIDQSVDIIKRMAEDRLGR